MQKAERRQRSPAVIEDIEIIEIILEKSLTNEDFVHEYLPEIFY